MADELDDIEAFESREPHGIPVGWGVLFWGLIVFGAWYLWAYTPGLGGWSQAGELSATAGQASQGTGVNILATILFTAVATAVAVGILVAAARRRAR